MKLGQRNEAIGCNPTIFPHSDVILSQVLYGRYSAVVDASTYSISVEPTQMITHTWVSLIWFMAFNIPILGTQCWVQVSHLPWQAATENPFLYFSVWNALPFEGNHSGEMSLENNSIQALDWARDAISWAKVVFLEHDGFLGPL
jgi:hypothetical protein